MDFDVIVIGSGFGGAVTSCRLAEKGKKVLVLERGKKWDRTTYPREPQDEWIWSHVDPEQYHGWTDLRRFKGMAVIDRKSTRLNSSHSQISYAVFCLKKKKKKKVVNYSKHVLTRILNILIFTDYSKMYN